MTAHKIRHTMQFTEISYYDDDGEEIGRETIHDHHTYDSGDPEPLTEQERKDWL